MKNWGVGFLGAVAVFAVVLNFAQYNALPPDVINMTDHNGVYRSTHLVSVPPVIETPAPAPAVIETPVVQPKRHAPAKRPASKASQAAGNLNDCSYGSIHIGNLTSAQVIAIAAKYSVTTSQVRTALTCH
jgi:hypothetical protein